MVVICPKCKVKLKVDDTKLSLSGSRFKCPNCSTVLVLKKPSVQIRKNLNSTKILLAHSNPEVMESASAILKGQGYEVIPSSDGIDVMVKALKELPFLIIVEVSLPKIYGFEICKKLKLRAETKDMKFILIPSIFDKSKYRREPASLYGADDYIEAQDIPAALIEKISKLVAVPGEEEAEKPRGEQKTPVAPEQKTPEINREVKEAPEVTKPCISGSDVLVEKARRLSRTIVSDIYLYNTAKMMESIKTGSFYSVFAAELREGQKLYESRIPQEIRSSGSYFKETIEEFIAKKKKELS